MWKQIIKEAQRRVKEDGYPRVIYLAVGANLGICLLDDWEERDVLDDCLAFVWPDKIEVI